MTLYDSRNPTDVSIFRYNNKISGYCALVQSLRDNNRGERIVED